MDTKDALRTLDLEPGAPPESVRAAYRALVRAHHPDVVGPTGHERTARLIEAYRLLVATGTDLAEDRPADEPLAPADDPPAPEPTTSAATPTGLADDTIAVVAPAEETFALLHDAAGRIGEVAYLDPDLGILETVVRFEGGPTCSLVLTLQGRADHTEVFCTLTSIEAAPTPPIGPAVDALVEELRALA